MKDVKVTPGPWLQDHMGRVVTPELRVVSVGPRSIGTFYGDGCDEGNERAIAAVPELLAACRLALETLAPNNSVAEQSLLLAIGLAERGRDNEKGAA